MAYFAQLNDDMIVTAVVSIDNQVLLGDDGYEIEQRGVNFCNAAVAESHWVQTSYNNRIRRRYAGIGMVYSQEHDAFLLPQPYPSWTLDLDNPNDWVAPTAIPDDKTQIWRWEESNGKWVGDVIPLKPPVQVLEE